MHTEWLVGMAVPREGIWICDWDTSVLHDITTQGMLCLSRCSIIWYQCKNREVNVRLWNRCGQLYMMLNVSLLTAQDEAMKVSATTICCRPVNGDKGWLSYFLPHVRWECTLFSISYWQLDSRCWFFIACSPRWCRKPTNLRGQLVTVRRSGSGYSGCRSRNRPTWSWQSLWVDRKRSTAIHIL